MTPSHSNLNNLRQYLSRYPNCHPDAFEYLVARAFSQIFDLPFQSRDNEDNTVSHRVIWHGSAADEKNRIIVKSPSGPDSICYAYGFSILVEATLRKSSDQWRNEFVESLKHYDAFLKNESADKEDVFLTLIFPKLHRDTHTGFQQKAKEGHNIVLLESPHLAKIWDTCKTVFTARHLDLHRLFDDLAEKLREATSFDKFRRDLNKSISEWQKKVSNREKTVFFGLKSYEAMKRVGEKIVGMSGILGHLQGDRKVERYMRMLGGGDLKAYIKDGLVNERLADSTKAHGEDMFCRISHVDFEARGLRLIKAVKEINA